MRVTRRTLAGSIGVLALGATGVGILPDRTAAVTVDDLSVPDHETTVSNPVETARLSVSGEWRLDGDTAPSRVVLRLEAQHNGGEWTQLDATEPGGYEPTMTEDYSLSGPVTNLPNVTSGELTPGQGNTRSLDFTIRVQMTAYDGGEELAQVKRETQATLQITRKDTIVTAEIGGSGDFSVETRTETT